MQVITRVRSGRAIQRCHNKNPDRGCDQGCEWRHATEAWAKIWEKSVSCYWDLGEARRICALRAPHVMWGRWKSQHRKMVSLSLCRKTLKLKSNKKFRTWSKKSSSAFVFRDSYVLCLYVMNILCTFHILMYGYVTVAHYHLILYIHVYKCVCVCVQKPRQRERQNGRIGNTSFCRTIRRF